MEKTVKNNEDRVYQQVKDVLTKEVLEDLYHNKLMTSKEIGKRYNTDPSWVLECICVHKIRRLEHFERLHAPKDLDVLQEQLLIGNLMGDGHVSKEYANALFTFSQSIQRAGYVRWLANRYKPWLRPSGVHFVTVKQKYNDTVKYFKRAEFSTICHPVFNKFRELFYPNGKKVIPRDLIKSDFSELSLAVWFADDGCSRECPDNSIRIFFCTDCFSKEDQLWMCDFLKSKFNLETILRSYKETFRIFVPPISREAFYKLISPILMKIPCLIYKIPKRYRYLESSQTIRPTENKISDDIVDGSYCHKTL